MHLIVMTMSTCCVHSVHNASDCDDHVHRQCPQNASDCYDQAGYAVTDGTVTTQRLTTAAVRKHGAQLTNVNAKNYLGIDQEATERQGAGQGEQSRAALAMHAPSARISTE